MTSEQDVRDALRTLAGHEPVRSEAWTRISTAIDADERRRRRMRWGVTGGAGIALAAAASITALAVVDRGDGQVEVVPPATEAPTPTTAPTPITAPPPTTAPSPTAAPAPTTAAQSASASAFVVLTSDGVATLHHAVGNTVELASRVGDVSLAPNHLYYSDANGVWRVRLDGQGREQLLALEPPSFPDVPLAEVGITTDERLLAYTTGGVDTSRIYVRDLTTGETREWATAPDEEDFFLVQGGKIDLAWAPDGRRLAFVNSYEGNELLVLDTATAASLSDAVHLGAINYASPSWIDDERLLAVGECCYPEYTEVRARVDVLAAADGAVVQEDLLGDTDVVAVERVAGGIAYITAEQRVFTLADGQTTPATLIAENAASLAG
jgi:hypothetical protein